MSLFKVSGLGFTAFRATGLKFRAYGIKFRV